MHAYFSSPTTSGWLIVVIPSSQFQELPLPTFHSTCYNRLFDILF
jgi:hypothetical protein